MPFKGVPNKFKFMVLLAEYVHVIVTVHYSTYDFSELLFLLMSSQGDTQFSEE